MRKPDEAAGMILLGLPHAIVDQPARRQIRLIETGAAGEHAGIDAGLIHDADMRSEIGEQRIEQIIRIAVLVHLDRDRIGIALEQFWRGVVLLEVDEHVYLFRHSGLPRSGKSGIHIHNRLRLALPRKF